MLIYFVCFLAFSLLIFILSILPIPAIPGGLFTSVYSYIDLIFSNAIKLLSFFIRSNTLAIISGLLLSIFVIDIILFIFKTFLKWNPLTVLLHGKK